MEPTNKIKYEGVEEYIFHFDHDVRRWCLISTNMQGFSLGMFLSDFLAVKHIQIPDDCLYCYYTTDCAEIKFREHGSYIQIYYNLIYGKNS